MTSDEIQKRREIVYRVIGEKSEQHDLNISEALWEIAYQLAVIREGLQKNNAENQNPDERTTPPNGETAFIQPQEQEKAVS